MKKNLILLFAYALIVQKTAAQDPRKEKIWNYPVIKPDTTIDFYFGKKVIDPYRNLENFESEVISKVW